jgi:hypothetical protein
VRSRTSMYFTVSFHPPCNIIPSFILLVHCLCISISYKYIMYMMS